MKLLSKKFDQIYIPHVASAIAQSLILGIDSVIAAHSIGMEALAALALAAPFMAIDEVLHCLLCSGISTHMPDLWAKANEIEPIE